MARELKPQMLDSTDSKSVPMDNLIGCVSINEMMEDRLECYDTLVPPTPKPKPAVAKVVTDCKFLAVADRRLSCFDRFLNNAIDQRCLRQKGSSFDSTRITELEAQAAA